MFFESWQSLLTVLGKGVLGYILIVGLLRASGKRTLSKMNAFDLIVTVALGSTLATVILSKDVTLAQGLVAFVVLVVGQLVVTWLSVRSERFQRIIKAQPSLIYFRGRHLDAAMKRLRVTREEVDAAVRSEGHGKWDEVEAVVLETDGSISVLTSLPADSRGTLEHVEMGGVRS